MLFDKNHLTKLRLARLDTAGTVDSGSDHHRIRSFEEISFKSIRNCAESFPRRPDQFRIPSLIPRRFHRGTRGVAQTSHLQKAHPAPGKRRC